MSLKYLALKYGEILNLILVSKKSVKLVGKFRINDK